MTTDISNILALAEMPGRGPELTEDAAALAFAELYNGQLLFDHDMKAWFRWTGTYWRAERTKLAFDWARDLVRDMTEEEASKTKVTGRKAAFTSAVERFAQADRRFAVSNEDWNKDPFLLATRGGTIDLRTGELRPAAPSDRINKIAGATPAKPMPIAPTVASVPFMITIAMREQLRARDFTDEQIANLTPQQANEILGIGSIGGGINGGCERWLKFLDEATGKDDELIAFLQRWCGYCLTGDIREHALIFGYGPGGTGKTVFSNTIAGILGDYAKTAAMETFVATEFASHPTDLAHLHGARLVTAAETEEGRAWAENRIKRITGGDPISARYMRCDFFTYTPTFKLMFIGNHEPALRNVDDAARRRFNVVPFTRKPATVDRQLQKKLEAEWPGILRWMIEGCLAWQNEGLNPPASVLIATSSYFDNQDLFGQWLEDKCDIRPGDRNYIATSAQLYASWSAYAKAAGDTAGSRKGFGRLLERRKFVPFKAASGASGVVTRSWYGIAIRQEKPPDDDRRYPT